MKHYLFHYFEAFLLESGLSYFKVLSVCLLFSSVLRVLQGVPAFSLGHLSVNPSREAMASFWYKCVGA